MLNHPSIHRRICPASGLAVKLRSSANVDTLPLHMQRSLFRIVQEALANVHRHASASRVSVDLRWISHRLHVIVTDNGHGAGEDAGGAVVPSRGWYLWYQSARAPVWRRSQNPNRIYRYQSPCRSARRVGSIEDRKGYSIVRHGVIARTDLIVSAHSSGIVYGFQHRRGILHRNVRRSPRTALGQGR